MKKITTLLLFCVAFLTASAQNQREVKLFNEGWKFHFGNASSPSKDFGSGTEYFNYLTKAASIHNEGPYALKFNDADWQEIKLPHDWATFLPYAAEASHSHGYHTVGFKYPETSVGWYRKEFTLTPEDKGYHYYLRFDGIFRNAIVWINGFFMGTEPSGYATQVYDLTDYLDYGGKNVVTVRADATLEEGWFYEGAGIYRDVWFVRTAPVHVKEFGTFVYSTLQNNYTQAHLTVETKVENNTHGTTDCEVSQTLIDAEGNKVLSLSDSKISIKAMETVCTKQDGILNNVHLWNTEDPYLYTLRTEIKQNGKVIDVYDTKTGFREAKFTVDKGLLLNGKQLKLKGVNMHQDEAGVGAAIPVAVMEYRIERLKSMGVNAYRSSHNPMFPAMLDVCDKEGILVIDENRLVGINQYHKDELLNMIERDRNHPSVIMWSIGNEEWGVERNDYGERIAHTMTDFVHLMDPTRPATVATSGGDRITRPVDVAGYNYIVQNDVEGEHKRFPQRIAYGSEETSGCGTRGIYYTDEEAGHMASINRTDTTYLNKIERGWKFYAERDWLSGLFYWTGFDYKGEPNPLKYPAVDSEFGILDYCGFEKDEAYYLKSWWTDETVLHILPHWNLKGHEGEEVDVWAYSNCDEVELIVNGKKLGKKAMPKNGHLSWKAIYKPGTVKAIGYKNKKKVKEVVLTTNYTPTQVVLEAHKTILKADNQDVAVIAIKLQDKKGNTIPTACQNIQIKVSGKARILGVGNGDPAYKEQQNPNNLNCKSYTVPSFNGLAQVLVQSTHEGGEITVTCSSEGLKEGTLSIIAK